MYITKNEKKELVATIINVFEDFLQKRGIIIHNDVRTEASYETDHPEDLALIYGSDYGDLQDTLLALFEDPKPEKQNLQQIVFFTKEEAECLQLSQIGLSGRVWHALGRSGFIYVKDVSGKPVEYILSNTANFGTKSLEELKEKLSEIGIGLSEG